MDWRAAVCTGYPVEESALAGSNNFNLLRLFAAALVLYSHSFHLSGLRGDEPVGAWFTWFDASILGVSIFFFISGFLVCRSWDMRQDPVAFLTARALRIAPAYWCVLLIAALIVGPATTTHSLAGYFGDPETLKYVAYGAVIHTQYLLPGVFEHLPEPGVNGSLWTIRLEVALYLMLAIVGSLIRAAAVRRAPGDVPGWSRPVVRAALVFVWLLLLVKVTFAGPGYYHLAGYFLLGVACYRLRSLCVLRLGLTLLLAGAAIACGRTWFGPVLMPIAIAHLVLTLALHPALLLPRGWLHRNDYSYGLYLYGFPVQQSLVAMNVVTPMIVFGWALLVTAVCAALSWHLIERPLLGRKDAIISRVRAWRIVRDWQGQVDRPGP